MLLQVKLFSEHNPKVELNIKTRLPDHLLHLPEEDLQFYNINPMYDYTVKYHDGTSSDASSDKKTFNNIDEVKKELFTIVNTMLETLLVTPVKKGDEVDNFTSQQKHSQTPFNLSPMFSNTESDTALAKEDFQWSTVFKDEKNDYTTNSQPQDYEPNGFSSNMSTETTVTFEKSSTRPSLVKLKSSNQEILNSFLLTPDPEEYVIINSDSKSFLGK